MTETSRSVSEDPFAQWITALLAAPAPTPTLTEVGKVTEVGVGVAVVSGLARALADEVLVFACGVRGIVLDLQPGRLGVILLGPSERITLGETVHRTHKVVSVPVGPALLGRVLDALGHPRDGLGPVAAVAERPIEGAGHFEPVCDFAAVGYGHQGDRRGGAGRSGPAPADHW